MTIIVDTTDLERAMDAATAKLQADQPRYGFILIAVERPIERGLEQASSTRIVGLAGMLRSTVPAPIAAIAMQAMIACVERGDFTPMSARAPRAD